MAGKKRTYAGKEYSKAAKKYKSSSNYRVVKSIRTKSNIPVIQKVCYSTFYTINYSSIGSLDSYVFRANSIFDPDFTGVGHQPIRHDQLAVFYDHYTVLSAKITVLHQGTGASNTSRNPFIYGVYLSDTGSPSIANCNEAIENGAVFKVTNENSSNSGTMVTRSFDAKTFFGVADVIDNRANLGATFGSNPTEGAYFVVFMQPVDHTTDVGSGEYTIKIDYTVQCNERKYVPGS